MRLENLRPFRTRSLRDTRVVFGLGNGCPDLLRERLGASVTASQLSDVCGNPPFQMEN